ncbi:2-succinyl-5-enolpyruvyl-6-hydroxy-3-cyclohexene-1-carboxylic-acid synthase [Anaerolineales bacterium HSG24]|nr:2-succinyl-5-enolpyruvyl-6-hydroxy-3-cyclohexene-1-carboxylic-acid synthase [Anaerolineales bacterium HSG24]
MQPTITNHHLTHNLAYICAHKGMKQVIISPGSRSAPLTVAFARQPNIHVRIVVDERSAAFIALGLAQQTRQPVGLVCSSGTAPLNYGPAVAEAFYQQLPLILMTADRPPEWIDQRDNQTSHQPRLFQNHVRASFELPVDVRHPDALWQAERTLSEALNRATWPFAGPVHINIPLREPLYPAPDVPFEPLPPPKIINQAPIEQRLSQTTWDTLLTDWRQRAKRLIIVGMQNPDPILADALAQLQQKQNAVILADLTANLHQDGQFIYQADLMLSLPHADILAPDLLITCGGPVISKQLKLFLRQHRPQIHWHVEVTDQAPDTYQSLTHHLSVESDYFFSQLLLGRTSPVVKNPVDAGRMSARQSNYQHQWRQRYQTATNCLDQFLDEADFGEFTAMHHVLNALPAPSRLQLGNSMPVRYADLIGLAGQQIQVNANRGTSGIDGCVSNAVGAALATDQLTTLIVGDLAFFYDQNGLWHDYHPTNLRLIVMNNQGGGIFSLINGPSNLPPSELTNYFTTPHQRTVRQIATDYNCDYYYNDDEISLIELLEQFFEPTSKPAILEIKTDRQVNIEVFEQYKRMSS